MFEKLEAFIEELQYYVFSKLMEKDENLFDKLDQEFNEDDVNAEEESEQDDSNIYKRKLVWLAAEFDRLSARLLIRLKRDSRMLPILHELNTVRDLFRFFLNNYKLYSDEERHEIVNVFEKMLKYFSEQLEKYLKT